MPGSLNIPSYQYPNKIFKKVTPTELIRVREFDK